MGTSSHLPEPPDKLRERARASAEELQRLAVAVPSAALGVFFLALTQKIEPALTNAERVCLLIAIAGMSISAAASITTWFADAAWNRNLAEAKEAEAANKLPERDAGLKRIARWQRVDAGAGIVFLIAFVPALLATFLYIWLRAK